MIDMTSIARPYASAAFLFAKANKQLPQWSRALNALAQTVANKDVVQMIHNPVTTNKQQFELLQSIVHAVLVDGDASINTHVENLLRLLIENKRLFALPDIATLFENDLAKDAGFLRLGVTSAFKLNEQQRQQVQKKLQHQLKSELVIEYHIDSALIGGMIVRSGDWVLDDSIRGKLDRLQSAMH